MNKRKFEQQLIKDRAKFERCYYLRNKLAKQPIGNKIKKGGNLEASIRAKFKKRADEILTRDENYNYDKWSAMRTEFVALRDELGEENWEMYLAYGTK